MRPETAKGAAAEEAAANSEEEAAAGDAEPEAKPEAEPALPPAAARTAVKPGSAGEEEVVRMSMLRRTVAKRLVEARQQMAMLTTFNEVDMSAVQSLRHEHQEAFEKRHQVKLGLMSFFVRAAVDALKQFPQLNAEVRGNDIVYRNYFNVGVAIATGRGLVVPVLRHAERLSFAEVEEAIGDYAQRAKEGKLKPDELEGATFTITNGGVFIRRNRASLACTRFRSAPWPCRARSSSVP
jgi:2-oxoglutarate dehydrogenase E2 component (dihydrolipoamide succinyltransferase)